VSDSPFPPPAANDAEAAESAARWRALLDGSDPSLRKLRRLWRHLPAAPRCKVCAAPFHGFGALATRLIMHGQTRDNPLLCNMCFGTLAKHPGGAEVDVSVVFADIRGSTGLAERLGAEAFRRLLQRFYELSAAAVDRSDGIVDKLLGDGVMALFIPVIAGENHRLRAIEAGRRMLVDVESSDLRRHDVRIGVGVHSGSSFVGVVGTGSKLDLSALGDTVNSAARLGSAAGPGELLVSTEAWRGAGLAIAGRRVDEREITGRENRLRVVSLGGAELADDDVFRPGPPAATIVE
jgi:adenylate cyclase